MSARILTLSIVFGLAVSAANAMEVKDVVKLSKLQLEAEVIIAQIKAKKAVFTLSTDQLVELKKAGVPDRVIKHMIETGAKATAKKTSPKTAAGKEETATPPSAEKKPPAPAAGAEKEPADGKGTLILENMDSKVYSIQFDAKNKRIFYWQGVAPLGRSKMPANTSMIYRVDPGTYKLRWVGEIPVYSVQVTAGKKSRASLTRTEKDGSETLDLHIYQDGVRRGGGRLVILADRSPAESTHASAPAAPAVAAAPTVVEKHYYHPAPDSGTYVVREQHPVCYSNYCSRGHYHPGCRFYRRYRHRSPTIGVIYGWKRGKSRYAIGVNSHGDLGFTYGRKVGRGRYAIGIGW